MLHLNKNILAFLRKGIVLVFAVIVMMGVFPEKAQAGGAVFCANCSNLVTQLIERALAQVDQAIQAIISANSTAGYIKEYVLDPAAWALKTNLLNRAVDDMINVAEGQFSDRPAYIRNFAQHYLDEAKKEALAYGQDILDLDICDFYAGDPSAFGDFKTSLKIGIENSSKADRDAAAKAQTCKLNGVTGNAPGAFLSGQFAVGGWDAWNVAMIQGDNPIQKISTQQRANTASQAAAIGNAAQDADNGNGAQSTKDANGNIKTPGAVINYQLNASIGSKLTNITNIDELGEMLGAFVSTIVVDSINDLF